MNDVKKQIVEILKSKGFSKDRVSVKEFKDKLNYDFKILIKDMSIPIRQIEDIVKPFEHVRRDFEGEILNGGNTFIEVMREAPDYGKIPKELIQIIERVKESEFLTSMEYEGFIIKNYDKKIKLMNSKKLKQEVNVACYSFDTANEIAEYFHHAIRESNLNEAYLNQKR